MYHADFTCKNEDLSLKVLVFQRLGSGDFAVNIVQPQENPRDTDRASAEKRLGCISFS
jgi:hypothetical protein